MNKKKEGLKKHTTNINEVARELLGITRDDYALCQYVQYRLADPRGKKSGWCSDTKEEIARFIGITRPGLYKMLDRMERLRLMEVDPSTGFCRVTANWIDTEINRKQSLQPSVNKVDTERKQSLQDSVNKVTLNIEEKDIEIEEKEQHQESSAAASDIQIESTEKIDSETLVEKGYVEAEKIESPKVALKGSYSSTSAPGESAPRRFDAFDIDSAAVELKENAFSAENFARITGTPSGRLASVFTSEVDVFVLEQKGKKTVYNRFDQFSSHFFNYVRAKARDRRSVPSQSHAPSNIPSALQGLIGK